MWIEFLHRIGDGEQGSEPMLVHLQTSHAIDAGETFPAFLLSVVAGARGPPPHAALVRRLGQYPSRWKIRSHPNFRAFLDLPKQ